MYSETEWNGRGWILLQWLIPSRTHSRSVQHPPLSVQMACGGVECLFKDLWPWNPWTGYRLRRGNEWNQNTCRWWGLPRAKTTHEGALQRPWVSYVAVIRVEWGEWNQEYNLKATNWFRFFCLFCSFHSVRFLVVREYNCGTWSV